MTALAHTLNKRVTIQQRATGADEYGQPLTGWTDVATIWAGIRDLTGRQYTAAQAAQNPITRRLRCASAKASCRPCVWSMAQICSTSRQC